MADFRNNFKNSQKPVIGVKFESDIHVRKKLAGLQRRDAS
jgi:hypothetical protein